MSEVPWIKEEIKSNIEKDKWVGFRYDYVERELIEHLKEIFAIYTTEDAELNMKNKAFLVDRIQGKLKDHGITIEDKEFIGIVLDMLRVVNDITLEENQSSMDLRSKDLFLYIIASTFYKVGIEAYSMEENSIPGLAAAGLNIKEENLSLREAGILSEATWVMLAFVYIADSGLNYRRYL